MRLFIAITPPAEVRDLLIGRTMEIERAKWVKKEHLHVTLRFIGEVDEVTAEKVQDSLRSVAAAPFELRIAGVGRFGHPPRVLWAGLSPTAPLEGLAAAIEPRLAAVGLAPPDRPFSPHITLARLKNSPPVMIRRYLERNEGLELPPFEVKSFSLFSSVLGNSGPTHRVIEAYPLVSG